MYETARGQMVRKGEDWSQVTVHAPHSYTFEMRQSPNLRSESDHCYVMLLLLCQPVASPRLYLLSVPRVNCNQFNYHERLDFFSLHQPPATNLPFFSLSSPDCAMIQGTCTMTFAFHMLQKICHMKIFITIYFHISMQYKLIIGRTGACRGISIKSAGGSMACSSWWYMSPDIVHSGMGARQYLIYDI